MIQIENLVKTYGQVCALDGLSLVVEPGVVYGFLGPNGAGKTTTMRILAGLAHPDSGYVSILNREVSAGADVRAMIGVMPEEPAFYGWMTAREFLRDLVAPLYGIPPGEAASRAAELLETVDLQKAADRRIHGFSRGMRQRLSLAGALVHRPPVLLLDEPVSALDPAGRVEVLDLIESLRGETTILLSTHILADVERVCDVIGIIDQGRLVLQEKRLDLLARYAQPIIEIEVENGNAAWIDAIRALPVVQNVILANHTARILVSDLPAAQKLLLENLSARNLLVRRFEVVQPSLEDIFLRLTRGGAGRGENAGREGRVV
jgi:ABC-2 type transport system ATP-binding protein